MSTTENAGASARITAEVTSWPGVEAGWGRRGEWSFRVGRREIGHLHGDHAAHFMLPKDVFDELFAAGRIVHHPVFPDRRGPGARRIEDDADVEDVIALLREQYERASGSDRRAGPSSARETAADGAQACREGPLTRRSPAGSGGSPAGR